MLSRSICLGLLRKSSKSTQPLSSGLAVLEMWARTRVTVTQTFVKSPMGALQVGGSLSVSLTLPVVGCGVVPPPQLASSASVASTPTSSGNLQMDQNG